MIRRERVTETMILVMYRQLRHYYADYTDRATGVTTMIAADGDYNVVRSAYYKQAELDEQLRKAA